MSMPQTRRKTDMFQKEKNYDSRSDLQIACNFKDII